MTNRQFDTPVPAGRNGFSDQIENVVGAYALLQD
jgi:hypothetical protein